MVEKRLKDHYRQKWQSDIRESSKGQIYNIFKTEFGSEKYFNLLPQKFRTILTKVKTANYHLPIEIWRWCDAFQNLKELAMPAIWII